MSTETKTTQNYEAQGYKKVETVVLHGPGVILSTKPTPEAPWREDAAVTTNQYIDIDTVIKLLSIIDKTPELHQRETYEEWLTTYQRLETSHPSELLVKIDQGTLHLVAIYPEGETVFSLHGGSFDIHGIEEERCNSRSQRRPSKARCDGVPPIKISKETPVK